MGAAERTVFCVLILIGLHVLLAPSQGTTHEIDICNEEQKFRCENEHLISLGEVACGNGSSCTADTNKTLYYLCQGQQTCSNVDIKAILASHCRSEVRLDSVRVKFHCIPGSTKSCLTNICADSSAGLTCPEGSVVHLRGMTCSSVTGRCSRSVYTNLFLCEGVSRCAASGLKTLMSQNCQHEAEEKRNVIIHYFCVPGQQIENRCSSTKYRVLDRDFGVIRSPNFDSNNRHTSNECRWIINPVRGNRVKVTVHLVNTKITRSGCDPGVLNITFEDCNGGSVITRSFCIVDNSSVELIACGQVKVSSVVPRGEESADMFIVSYERFYHSSISSAEPSDLPNCIAPPVVTTPDIPPQRKTSSQPSSAAPVQPFSKAPVSITQNYGPGDGVFEYRDSWVEEGVTGADNTGESSTMSKQLKLVILYIFFGVVILVLTIALVAVLISYFRISKLNHHSSDTCEKTALCQHHEDTPLDTFQNHTLDESCGNLTSETTYAFRTDHDTDQVMATVHHDSISEQDEFDHRLSSGSGISTFLSGKRDTDFRDLINSFQTGTFALYSSLGNNSSDDHINMRDGGYYEMADAGHYDIPSDSGIYEAIDQDKPKSYGNDNNHVNSFSHDVYELRNHEDESSMLANHDQQPLVGSQQCPSSSDLHYRINNDEYAVVCKTMKQPKNVMTTEEQHQPFEICSQHSVNGDFCPTSGPYDRKTKSAADSNARWSKGGGERWGDEI